MDISEFLNGTQDSQIVFPIDDAKQGESYPVSHHFLNGSSAVFNISPRETVRRSLTQVFNATISDPAKTIKDLPPEFQPERKTWAHPIGAVYDSKYKLVAESQFRNNQVLPEVTLERPKETLRGTWVFLGYYNEVYGHFILESLCRLWVLEFLKAIKVRFFFLPIRNYHQFKGSYTEPFLEAFNSSWQGSGTFTDLIDVVTKPVRMERVIVPSRSFDIQGGARLDFLSVMDKLKPAPPILPSRRRYYLSRRNLPLAQHKFINEGEIERVFECFNFKTVHPQDLSYQKQMRVYQSASHLGGAISSALHNSIFSPEGCHVIGMNGRWPQTGRVNAAKAGTNFPNPVCPQDRICAVKDQKLSYIENYRAFHLEGMLPGRMMYFIGPKYCYELMCEIMGETPVMLGLTNGLSDEAIRVLLLESTEFAINGNALYTARRLMTILSDNFRATSQLKKQLWRFERRLLMKKTSKIVDTQKKYTLFPDSNVEVVEAIIDDSSPLAARIMRTLVELTA